jgi:NAD(P)-dependent dehydrogenase (short-subunit alcohol dehydrogenase family)
MGRLDRKTALITGAATGIGAQFAYAFSEAGARVVIADIQDGSEVANSINDHGGRAAFIQADITNDDSLMALRVAAEELFGPVSIVVNNAALFAQLKLQPFWELSNEDWDRMLTVNVRGVAQVTRAMLPSLRAAGGGSVINITSGTVYKGPPGQMHYVASKGAVLAMTRSMARELSQECIRVNSISPGLTMTQNVLENPAWAPFREQLASSRLIQRDMQPADLVGAALFLASDDSGFVTGQSLNVDGGVYFS